MNQNTIQNIIREKTGSGVVSLSPVGSGCISPAYKAALSDGDSAFVKVSPQFPDMFLKEANGLRELAKANAIRIPNILYAGEEILILECLPVTSPSNRKKFFEAFGRQFALLHKFTSPAFGFYEDNYIGSTPQKNMP